MFRKSFYQIITYLFLLPLSYRFLSYYISPDNSLRKINNFFLEYNAIHIFQSQPSLKLRLLIKLTHASIMLSF